MLSGLGLVILSSMSQAILGVESLNVNASVLDVKVKPS